MTTFIVKIPGSIEVYEEDVLKILNEGIFGACCEPIIVTDLDLEWDKFNKENGWWDFGYLEYIFYDHYDGAEEFLNFLKLGEEKEK